MARNSRSYALYFCWAGLGFLERRPGVLDALLQHGAHGGRGGVSDQWMWCRWIGVCHHWWSSRWESVCWLLVPGKTTTWLRPVGRCFGSPPGDRNGRGSRRRWEVVLRRSPWIVTWNLGIVPGWGWGTAVLTRDGGAVSRAEVVVDAFPASWNEPAGIHAEVWTCVTVPTRVRHWSLSWARWT
jgi:hypothetical protein